MSFCVTWKYKKQNHKPNWSNLIIKAFPFIFIYARFECVPFHSIPFQFQFPIEYSSSEQTNTQNEWKKTIIKQKRFNLSLGNYEFTFFQSTFKYIPWRYYFYFMLYFSKCFYVPDSTRRGVFSSHDPLALFETRLVHAVPVVWKTLSLSFIAAVA